MVAFRFNWGAFSSLLIATSVALSSITFVGAAAVLTTSDLEETMTKLRGNDDRIFRWDTREHTAEVQEESCKVLPQIVDVMDKTNNQHEQYLICQIIAFCVTDNPENRELLATSPSAKNFHTTITDWLSTSTDPHVSASAAHVIYATSFNNPTHHAKFSELALEPLMTIVTSYYAGVSVTVQIMYALAALQNLAASYCSHPGNEANHDGRCYYDWIQGSDKVELEKDLVVVSSGAKVRQAMLANKKLIAHLQELVCIGHDGSSSPGINAQVGRDDNSQSLLAWAATAALKNMAIEERMEHLDMNALACVCYLAHYSADWLEKGKAQGLLDNLFRHDPCYFDTEKLNENGIPELDCIDQYFIDENGFDCSAYDSISTTYEDCHSNEDEHGIPAAAMCCACHDIEPGVNKGEL